MAALPLMAASLLAAPTPALTQSRSEAIVCSAPAPAGAAVLVDGRHMGQTPVRLRLEPDSTYLVTFRKSGYADATTTLSTRARSGWMVLDVFSGVLGFAMDYETNNWTFVEMVVDRPDSEASRP